MNNRLSEIVSLVIGKDLLLRGKALEVPKNKKFNLLLFSKCYSTKNTNHTIKNKF